MQLTNSTKYAKAITVTAGAAGATNVNGTTIDTQGFGGVAFIAQIGAVVAASVTSLKVQEGALADASDMADVTSATLTVADTDDEGIKVIDYYRPAKRYVRLVALRATQNATVTAIAALYNSREQVVAQPATTATALVHG